MNRMEGTRQSLSQRPSGRFTINEIQIFRRDWRFGKVWNPPTYNSEPGHLDAAIAKES